MRREASAAPQGDHPAAVLAAADNAPTGDEAVEHQVQAPEGQGNQTKGYAVAVEAVFEGLVYDLMMESVHQLEADIVAIVRMELVNVVNPPLVPGGPPPTDGLQVSRVVVQLTEGDAGNVHLKAYFIENTTEDAEKAKEKLTPVKTLLVQIQTEIVKVAHISTAIPGKKFHIKGQPAVVAEATPEDFGAVAAAQQEPVRKTHRNLEEWELLLMEFVWFLYWGGASFLILIPVCCYYGYLIFQDEVVAPRQGGNPAGPTESFISAHPSVDAVAEEPSSASVQSQNTENF